MKFLSKTFLVIISLVILPFALWVLSMMIIGIGGLPWFLSTAGQINYWQETPAYMQMSDMTFKIAPELKPIPYRWKEISDSAFVPSNSDNKKSSFRVFKVLSSFTIRCYKEYNCFSNLTKNEGLVYGTEFFYEPVFYTGFSDKNNKSFDDNFNYSNNPIQKYPGTKVEFSLISKEPLYFDSYVAVACGPDKRGEHIRPLICNFETLKTEIKQSSNEISMPNLRFVLVDHGGDKVESNVYQSELWPIILKGFEQLIRNSHISTIEAKNINNKAEGHWQADRHSSDYRKQ